MAEEVARQKSHEDLEAAAATMKKDIRRWLGWLGGKKDAEAWSRLRAIQDPLAVPAVIEFLPQASQGNVRKLLIEILGRIGTADALTALAQAALEADLAETRALCLEQLARHPGPQICEFFVKQLESPSNVRVRRAGAALEVVGDPSAVKPLIDALVTQHKTVVTPANPGQISGAFGNGGTSSGTGFSTGGGAKIANYAEQNREVLAALVKLTSVNFQYDQQAWLGWLIQERSKYLPVNLRRGE